MNEPKLTNIKYIKHLMQEHGIAFQKQFGQNFLINETIPRRIAKYVSGNVIEIGPGIGTLTQELAKCCEKVVSIEIDNGLIPILNMTMSDHPNVSVINADILKCDLPKLIGSQFPDEPVSVCANLPYNITTPTIMKLLRGETHFLSITVMVQKEVCDRFCAASGTRAYSAVSAVISYYAKAERLFGVSAGNFFPKPKVDSTVMRFLPYEIPPVNVIAPDFLIDVIHAAFAHRRKTLSNALHARYPELCKTMISEVILSCGFPADVRGERLNLADFAILSDKLFILIEK